MLISEATQAAAAHLNEGEEPPLATLGAAVPHYSLRLTAICVERRALPIIGEYILRAAACGFTKIEDIASFLGLPAEEIRREVGALQDAYLASTGHGQVQLMDKGRSAISADGLRTPVVRELPCLTNGVTRRIVHVPVDLVPRRRLPNGMLALPAVPARPPRSGELELHGVKEGLASNSNPTYRSLEISRVGRVLRATALFQPAYLMLRRGGHSVPTLSVDGTADSALAKHLGAHPALQGLKRQLGRQEQQVRHQLSSLQPKLRGQGMAAAEPFRLALSAACAWAQAENDQRAAAWLQFAGHARRLTTKSHWMGAEEFELLLLYASRSAAKRLLVVAGETGAIFTRELLESLGDAAGKGVRVELHMGPEEVASIARDPALRSRLKHTNITARPRPSGWCGLCCDSDLSVVGLGKRIVCSMGAADTFFGTLFANGLEGEALLRELSLSSIPVVVKKARSSSAPPVGPTQTAKSVRRQRGS